MVGAERENFEHLEPLDCRKQRFQSLNSTFLIRSFRCTNEGLLLLGIVTIKKSFHKEKGHFTSKEKGTFCVIFKVGGGGGLGPLGPRFLRPWL